VKKLIISILVIPLIIAAPSSATFTTVTVGGLTISISDAPNFVGGSWSATMQESGVNFDLLAVKMFSAGDSFEHPTLSSFDPSSWALLYENTPLYPTLASASGLTVSWLQTDIKFAGDSGNPLRFSLVVFDEETIAGSADVAWKSPGHGGWDITYGTWPTSRSDVPEPATICLLGFGALSLLKKRRA
jgi:hypothetical protein